MDCDASWFAVHKRMGRILALFRRTTYWRYITTWSWRRCNGPGRLSLSPPRLVSKHKTIFKTAFSSSIGRQPFKPEHTIFIKSYIRPVEHTSLRGCSDSQYIVATVNFGLDGQRDVQHAPCIALVNTAQLLSLSGQLVIKTSSFTLC